MCTCAFINKVKWRDSEIRIPFSGNLSRDKTFVDYSLVPPTVTEPLNSLYSNQSDYWGEPERAPHRRVECSQSIYVYIYILYIIMYGTSVTRVPLYKLYSNSRYIPEAA